MGNSKHVIIVALACLFLTSSVIAENKIVVNVDLPPCPYHDSRMDSKLYDLLSTIDLTEIVYTDSADAYQLANDDRMIFDDILAIGQKHNGRYLVDIDVERIDIERRKITIIPLFFYRYRVFGVLSGTLKVVDVSRKRIMETKLIDFEVKAADQWQVYDDDPDNPALLLPADKRVILLDEVDDKAANGIFEDIKKLTRGAFNRG